MRWLLAFLTVIFVYLTIDAFELRSKLKEIPTSVVATLWGRDVSYMSIADQERLTYPFRRRFMHSAWILAAISAVLIVVTVIGFIE